MNLQKRLLIPVLGLLLVLLSAIAVLAEYSLGTIYIQRDGSVVIEYRYSEPYSGYIPYSDYEGEIHYEFSFSEKSTSIAYRHSASAANVTTAPRLWNTTATITLNHRLEGGVLREEVAVYINVHADADMLKIATEGPIVALIDSNTLVLTATGKIVIEATGKYAEHVEHEIKNLRDRIDLYIEFFNATWVHIEKLISAFESGKGFVEFSVSVDLHEALKLTPKDAAELRSVITRLSYPATITYELRAVSVEGLEYFAMSIDARAEENANKVFKDVLTFISAVKTVHRLPYLSYIPLPYIEREPDEIARFASTFEIRPSSGYARLKLSGGTITVELRTPRVVKVGALTPVETIIELFKILGAGTFLERATFTLRPEEGIMVLLHGEPVTEVSFNDIPYLEVVFARPPVTPTPTSPPALPSLTPTPTLSPTPTPVQETSTPQTTETAGIGLPVSTSTIVIAGVAVAVAAIAVAITKLIAKKQ